MFLLNLQRIKSLPKEKYRNHSIINQGLGVSRHCNAVKQTNPPPPRKKSVGRHELNLFGRKVTI